MPDSPFAHQKLARELTRNWSSLRQALHFAWQGGRAFTVATILLSLGQAIVSFASLYFIKLLIDAVVLASTTQNPREALSRLTAAVCGIAILGLLGALCRTGSSFVGQAHAQAVKDYMSSILHAKAVEVDLDYYESATYYDALHRAQQEAPFRPLRILSGLADTTQSAMFILGIIALIYSFSNSIIPLIVIASLPEVIVGVNRGRTMYQWRRQRTKAERRSWYFDWLLTRDSHAKEIRVLGLGAILERRFRELRAGMRAEHLQLLKRRSAAEFCGQSLSILAIAISYGLIALSALDGAITPGELVMYQQAIQRGHQALRTLVGNLVALHEDSLFLANVTEFLSLKPSIGNIANAMRLASPLRQGIIFEHVSFHYPGDLRPILTDVSFSVRPGEKVALVGRNGSGKTTAVKLLCRLYDVSGGAIRIDGIDLRRLDLESLRGEIAVMFQDYGQYNFSVRENIWFGNVVEACCGWKIRSAAERSGAQTFIEVLPDGYETILGKWFEDGVELSSGEWQRLALARVFLRNAQVIVLDEPTSALDPDGERNTMKALFELGEGRSMVLVSHRLAAVRMADRIYFMEGGKIVEVGTHSELMRSGGPYASLFRGQAR